jgi:ABC-2 type transport system permease protein
MQNTFSTILSDVWVMTKRNLIRYKRLPQLVIFSFIQPMMFLLLFTYVFGGAIVTSNPNYITFLLPGVLVQTVLFGSMMTGVGLAEDVSKGMIDRFKSLPMSQAAVLAGRIITESIRNILIMIMMIIAGYIMGFRIEHGFGNLLLALLVIVFFGFAFSWVSAAIGLAVKNVETAQTAGFIWVFPLAFASSIFVPVETMVPAVRAFAENNPISQVTVVVRSLMTGTPLGNDIYWALGWIIALTVIFIPIAVSRYRKIS